LSQRLSTPPASVKASPIARRLAQEHGIDLVGLSGTGPGGRIVREDVERSLAGHGPAPAPPGGAPAAASGSAPPPPVVDGESRGEISHQKMTPTQRVMARRMVEARATVPDFTIEVEAAMEAAVALRDQLRRSASDGGIVPSYNDMVIRACGLALREYPRINGAVADDGYDFFGRVNIGMAVAAGDALLVPTVHDADQRGLVEVATETRALAQRARLGRLGPSELGGGTFTVSNLGMFGATRFTAVINPPQAAILTMEALVKRPWVVGDALAIRSIMNLCLCFDHRVFDGGTASRFLQSVKRRLENFSPAL